jgi:hypothetical protein
VIETNHRDALVRAWTDNSWRLMGEGRLLLEQRTFDPLTGVAQSTQTLIDGRGERETRTFSVRVYTATDLLRMLEGAGFADAKAYGSFEGDPFTTATRLVMVATK